VCAEPGQPSRRNPPRQPVLRVLPGTPEAAGLARQLARELLGDCPATQTVMLLVSELVTNAILHSRSGEQGGTVTVTLCPTQSAILVQVRDDGGPSEPRLSARPAGDAEHGYGLLLVDALADSWATLSTPDSRLTWCKVSRCPAASSGNEGAQRGTRLPGRLGEPSADPGRAPEAAETKV
jgi:anti-sigma regulatory factor (Ser/Thr protein kinase)